MQALPRCAGARLATKAAAAPIRRNVVRSETRNSSFVCNSCLNTSNRTFSSGSSRCNNNDNNSRAPAPTAPPPSSGYAALPSRRLISIAGVDAAKFLQGMITSNMSDLTTPKGPAAAGFYTGFLQATGRVLYDVFVYPDTLGLGPSDSPAGSSFLIECDDSRAGALMRHLKKYKLRSKFKFQLLEPEECLVWQAWDDATFSSRQNGTPEDGANNKIVTDFLPDQKGQIVLRDPRSPTMGLRVLGRGNDAPPRVQAELSDADAYRIRRYLDGVAEGATEIQPDAALPLEANMDWMGGIDFRKGCYLGQELTIRTKHRGVVRKRILPVVLYGESEAPPETLEYRPSAVSEGGLSAADVPHLLSIGRSGKKGRSAGSFLDGVGNIGLGLCRLQMMTDVQLPGEAEAAPFDPSKEFLMQWGGDEEGNGAQKLKVKAFVPEWLRSKISEGNEGAPRS
ncbi:Aminomethyltransferase folate-binding domain-containing protein [Apiospora rasikravindrae]|uniref:Iron-sulfur cluster assembly factor IBA57 homolog, mitochondrial n=1 Tax=Apiospora rasikravindrae TaxID=990691 RepID=A0ABR1RWY6_9PEZI